jgi:small acid-soluble spore protein H (minor)
LERLLFWEDDLFGREATLMDVDRAKSILQSPDIITVLYHEEPVWIDDVDTSKKTATVHSEKDADNRQIVEVTQLQEV